MKLVARIVLLLVVIYLGYEALMAYAFRYRQGYSPWPLIGVAVGFWAYLSLRPRHVKPRVVAAEVQSMDSVLFFLLAVSGSAFVLHMRGQEAFEFEWFVQLSVLTFFLLLLPSVIAYPFVRWQTVVTMLAVFFLLGILWKGEQLLTLVAAKGPQTIMTVGWLDSPSGLQRMEVR